MNDGFATLPRLVRVTLRAGAFALALALIGVPSAFAQCVFRIDVLDVGQGDALFVQSPDCHVALIDGGDVGSGAKIRAHLASLGVTALDAVFVTHYHQDHLAGLVELAKAPTVPVTKAYDRGGSYSSATYTAYASAYAGRRVAPSVGQVLTLGAGVTITVVSRDASTSSEDVRALGLLVTFGEIEALVAGDLQGNGEPVVAAKLAPLEIYKAHHHGSSTSSTDLLMAVIEPTLTAVSVGYGNSYGHPGADALDRIETWGHAALTEDPATAKRLGTITITSTDGLTYKALQGAWSATYVARKRAAGQLKTPSSVSVVTGTAAGTATSVATANSALYVVTAGAVAGGYQAAWQAKTTVPVVPSRLTVAWSGKASVASTQHLQLWNPTTKAWIDVGYHPVATTSAAQFHMITAPSKYRDAAGVVQARFVTDKRSTSYTVSTDVAWFVWEP